MRVDPYGTPRAAPDSGAAAANSASTHAWPARQLTPDVLETVWPEPVAVGQIVEFRSRQYRVVRSEPRRVACDDPLIFGTHLDGAEGAPGALVGLVAITGTVR